MEDQYINIDAEFIKQNEPEENLNDKEIDNEWIWWKR